MGLDVYPHTIKQIFIISIFTVLGKWFVCCWFLFIFCRGLQKATVPRVVKQRNLREQH